MESAGCPRGVPPRYRRPAGNQAKVQRVDSNATGGGKDGLAVNLRQSCPGQNEYFPTLSQLRHASYV
jgi:hypothetical protein